MRAWKAVAFLCLVSALACAQSDSAGQADRQESARLAESHHHVELSALSQMGIHRWDKSYLISYGFDGTFSAGPSRPAVLAYDQYDQIKREAIVRLNDAEDISVGDAAVTKNGNLVVTGALVNKGGISVFIAWIGNDGKIRKVTPTSPFLPAYICSCDDDGTVWVYGQLRTQPGEPRVGTLRLRHYSSEKGELETMLKIDGDELGWTLPEGRYPGEISLRCNSKSVVLYNAAAGSFYEYNIATNTLRATQIAPLPAPPKFEITGFALTESGGVFASLQDRSKQPTISGLYKLEFDGKGSAVWAPLPGTVGPFLKGGTFERLLGADGDDLVHTRQLDGIAYWSKIETR